MIQKKICTLGTFAVGKTSLVRQFVSSVFNERYHTTVGVKVDKKSVRVDDRDVNLMLWDIHGEDEFQKVRLSYLRGAAGYLLVVDGTRPNTLDRAYSIQSLAEQTLGDVPFVVVLNKCDLEDQWALDAADLQTAVEQGWKVLRTSAKSGEGVEESFQFLAREILAGMDEQS